MIYKSIIFLIMICFSIKKINKKKRLNEELSKEKQIALLSKKEVTFQQQKPKPAILVNQFQPVKYNQYNIKYIISFSNIYQKIIINNLWFDEPFYGLFYKFLCIFEANDLIIVK